MINVRILQGEGEILPFVTRLEELAIASGSTYLFNRPQIPLLWWKHFQSEKGADFGSKRGRNFYGIKSQLENIHFFVAENSEGFCGYAAMVTSSVTLKTNTPALKMLSFCADSVILFYQDICVLSHGRTVTLEALVKSMVDFAKVEERMLFLGHIPEDSPNFSILKNLISSEIQSAPAIQAENWSRGGVYPWTLHAIAKSLLEIKAILLKANPVEAGSTETEEQTQLEALVKRLEAQGPTLLNFGGTRKAFEKEIQSLCDQYRGNADTLSCVTQIEACFVGEPIQYPFLTLPDTAEAYLESLSTSRRYYFRRYLKKYSESGAEFECIDSTRVNEVDIEEYLNLHIERWGNDSVAINPLTMAFHRDLCKEAARQGLFRIFFAKYQGKRLVAHVCIDIGDRREYLFSGRTRDAEDLRAGKLMVMHTVLDAIQSGFKIYDFGYGGDEYKADFTKVFRTAHSFFVVGGELPDLNKLFPKYECMHIEEII